MNRRLATQQLNARSAFLQGPDRSTRHFPRIELATGTRIPT
jgi:hypothetical protein